MELCFIEDQPSWIYYYKYCAVFVWIHYLILPGKHQLCNEQISFYLSYSLLKSFDASKQKQLENDRNLSNLPPAKTSSSGRFVAVKPTKPVSANRVRSSSATSEDGTTRYVKICRVYVKQVNIDCWINSMACYNWDTFLSDNFMKFFFMFDARLLNDFILTNVLVGF